MKTRWGYVAAVALGASLVAVPAGAARLITGDDIKDDTVRSADIRNGDVTGKDLKNGSVAAADLARSLRNSPVTRYRSSSAATVAYSQTSPPTAGAKQGVPLTTTRKGNLLLLSTLPVSVTQSVPGTTQFTMTAALYLDGKPVAGSATKIPSGGTCVGAPAPCRTAFDSIDLTGLVIKGVKPGKHTLEVRFFGNTQGVMQATFPTFSVVEVG